MTIIGVIAAITVPTLIKKYNNYTVVSQLKKAQSTLAQATTAIAAEQGPAGSWACGPLGNTLYNNQCVDWYFSKLRIQCDGRGNLDSNGIKGQAAWVNRCKFPNLDELKTLNGHVRITDGSSFYLWTNAYPARTADGMIYGFVFGNWALYYASSYYGVSKQLGNAQVKMTVFVDINGNKGPNQTGRDIFPFGITTLGVIPFGNVPDMAKYPCTTADTVEYYHSGFSCTGKVLREGGIFY